MLVLELMLTKDEEQQLIEFKRDMHMHPELSHKEYKTTEKIRAFLKTIPGMEILPLQRELTGVVARMRGLGGEQSPVGAGIYGSVSERKRIASADGEGEKSTSSADEEKSTRRICEVGLRADIDAIAQTEAFESPWKSQNPGVMHACGHDFHTAALLGAALLLSRCRDQWSGTVDFLFQEAEETTDGAQEMMDAGLFDIIHPQIFFGFHNRPEAEAGTVICHRGALMAAKTNFKVTILGKGGHGGNPHLCTDPIVCAAALIQSLQTIVSRNTDPLHSVVLTVGSVHGGSVENLVVDRVEMTASIRALQMEAKDKAVSRMEEIVHGISAAYGCQARIEYREILPSVYNDDRMYALARRAAEQAVGPEKVIDAEPCLASEDFSLIMEKVPSFFYWIGSGTPGQNCPAWHHEAFHADDRGIRVGAETMARAALTALGL